MRKRYLLNIFVLNLIIVWVLASSGLAQQEEAEFTLALRQKEFRVAEPVVVELRVTNKGKKDMQFHRPSLAAQTFRFWIQNKEGLNEQYRSDYIVENIPLLTVAPGETFRTEESIFFNYEKNAIAFPQAGEYTLQVEYLGYISVASPPPAEILIKIIPNTPSDKEWEEFFRKKETLDFLNQFSADSATFQRLENLIKKYPKSAFTSYGKFYSAHQETSEYHNKSPDFEKAIESMKQADVKGFQLQPEALFYLAQWSWQLGRPEDAFGYLDRLIREFSDTPIAQSAAALKETWSTQKPPQPPKKVVPVDKKIKKEIENPLKKYFDAFAKADLEGCLAQLDENLIYKETLNKEGLAEELKEDFKKLAAQEGQLRVSWESEGWQMLDGVPSANVNISYFVNNQLLSLSRVRIEFIQKDKSWFFKSFYSQ